MAFQLNPSDGGAFGYGCIRLFDAEEFYLLFGLIFIRDSVSLAIIYQMRRCRHFTDKQRGSKEEAEGELRWLILYRFITLKDYKTFCGHVTGQTYQNQSRYFF